MSNPPSIEVEATGITIVNLSVPSRDIASQLENLTDEERVALCTRALEVGFFCLDRAAAGHSTDFIRQQLEATLHSVDRALLTLPPKVETALISKLGVGEGQALAPVHRLIEQVHAVTRNRLDEVKSLLTDSIDPAKETSTLGSALRSIQQLLDPNRTDSIQAAVQFALSDVSKADGPLAKVVHQVMAESITPLKRELETLGKEVRAKEAAAEAVRNTPLKGAPFEEEIVQSLNSFTMISGAQVAHVGCDNKAGDIVVEIPLRGGALVGGDAEDAQPLKVAIEARDRAERFGRKRIAETMNRVLMEREADAAVFVCRESSGLASEIGLWAEGVCEHGAWIATVHSFLPLAIRFLMLQRRMEMARSSGNADGDQVDWQGIDAQIQSIRTSLKRCTKVTKHLNGIRSSADVIETECKALRGEISASLSALEELLNTAT